jgi:hypothetical protein
MWLIWGLCTMLALACGLRLGGDGERALADLQDSAVAAFVTARVERNLPSGPLEYRAGGIYSAPPTETPDGWRVWQVRHARADVIALPLEARDRLAGVELKADILVRYEDRTCELAGESGGFTRCQPWQEASCCNQVWKRKRGEWLVELPR